MTRRTFDTGGLIAAALVAFLLTMSACDDPTSGDEIASNDGGDVSLPPAMPDGEEIPNWEQFPDSFRVVMMRGVAPDPFVAGNSLDGFEAAREQGIKYVEADFMLSKDDHLVATHHRDMSGDCGDVREKTLEELRTCRLDGDRRVATLDDLLDLAFEEVFVDLKESSVDSDDRLLTAARRAIDRFEAHDARERAVLMLYRVTDEAAELLDAGGIRSGIKGYPGDEKEVRELIDLAARHGMETMCVNASRLSAELIEESARQGIWQLSWDHVRESNAEHWRALAEAGLGGLIVDDDRLARDRAEPYWRDVRTRLD